MLRPTLTLRTNGMDILVKEINHMGDRGVYLGIEAPMQMPRMLAAVKSLLGLEDLLDVEMNMEKDTPILDGERIGLLMSPGFLGAWE